jgi:chromate reductase
MNSPEAYIQLTPGLIGDDGSVTDVTVADFLREFMVAFEQFIERVRMALPVPV